MKNISMRPKGVKWHYNIFAALEKNKNFEE